MQTAARILGDHVGSTAPVFLVFLAVHVTAGLTAVVTGAIAALTRKGSRSHVRTGRWYYQAISVVFGTAIILAAMRWRQDYYLFIIGAVAFTSATIGYQHRRRHRPQIPAISPAWAPPTWPCSPRSTSTTAPTCPCGTTCRYSRSGCSLRHRGPRHRPRDPASQERQPTARTRQDP